MPLPVAGVIYRRAALHCQRRDRKASIASKLSRATVPEHFFFAALVAIGCAAVTLEDI
jgi:hypothetical protein